MTSLNPTPRGTVLVTGGTSGIGAGVSRALAAAGCRVYAGTVSQAEIDAFAPTPGITPLRLDVTDGASVDAALAAIDGPIAGLVNCAGIIQRGGAEFEVDAFRRTLEVNLVGTMRMCLAVKPRLAGSGAAIVNTASMLSTFGSPFVPGYAASKGGVVQLTKSLAAAWATDGVRVNAVAPGWIATPLTQQLQDDEARAAPILQRTPMGRWGQPDEIGAVVCFLLSDAARFMTGAVMPVDGGYSAV
ncbi:SDR family NAD(P)-dependent oxidoreductase [Rubrivivax sp. RP6-9]|uniref:SDR family NAD(P)-dependent oxidoreductase n=1 Tax=Rubrivivax sp. RP6-9 TaxID=3415750 RepID=UPI003CC61883